MLFNRHLFIIAFSVFFIGMIFWWQTPNTAVSAMAKGEYLSNPYSIVKNYWKRLDYRQFDLASQMTANSAGSDHLKLEKMLKDNPLLSIQKTEIQAGIDDHSFLVKTVFGSVINSKQEITYLVSLGKTQQGWLITSIKAIL